MINENGNVTVFGKETEFEGVLEFTDSLVITGKFHGTIKAGGVLEIEKGAECSVDKMQADTIIISGNVEGDIEGKTSVELCSGSYVRGDIKTACLRIADNVEFDGQVSMLTEKNDVDIFSVASGEYKNALVVQNPDLKDS